MSWGSFTLVDSIGQAEAQGYDSSVPISVRVGRELRGVQ